MNDSPARPNYPQVLLEQEVTDSQQALLADIRRLASRALRRERPNLLLQSTAIVHEVWLRLRTQHRLASADRLEFMAAAAVTVHRVLVDHIRRETSQKRGGPHAAIVRMDPHELDAATADAGELSPLDLLALDEALTDLFEVRPRCAEVVRMRFFAGMSHQDIADHLKISVRTVQNDWKYAKAWLYRKLNAPGE